MKCSRLADAEVLLLLDVGDQRKLAAGAGALEEGVGRGEGEMVELGEAQQADPAQRQNHVEPPQRFVGGEQGGRLDAAHGQRDHEAHRRPIGPVAVLGDLRRLDAESLQQEAGHQQHAQPAQDQLVLGAGQPGRARPDPAMRDGHAHADQPDQPEEVAHQRVAQIAVADEDAHLVVGQVVVDGQQGGDEEQHQDAGHDAEMHDARVGVAQDALGAGAAAQHAAQAHAGLVEVEVGAADAPDPRPPRHAVDDDGHEQRQQRVEHPEVGDVEEQLAVGAVDAAGLGRRQQTEPAQRHPDRHRDAADLDGAAQAAALHRRGQRGVLGGRRAPARDGAADRQRTTRRGRRHGGPPPSPRRRRGARRAQATRCWARRGACGCRS